MANNISYIEIPSPDVGALSKFYEETFGWQMQLSTLTEQPDTMFKMGDDGLNAALDPSRKPSEDAGIIFYIRVNDIDVTSLKIESAGGKIVRPKIDIGGGYGFSAIFKDPCGNHIGLCADA